MNSILYIMNVDWNWIKQRPHFIAEGLSGFLDKYNVKIIYQHHYKRKSFQNRSYDKYDVSAMYVVPSIDRYPVINKLNILLRRFYYAYYIKKNSSNLLYLTYPTQIESVPNKYKGKIIYDCMDNYPMFNVNKKNRGELIKLERKICDRADIIICTSLFLQNELRKRYGDTIAGKIHLVRNGYSGTIVKNASENKHKENVYFTLCYFGTVSEWFDFDLVLQSLNDFENIKYVIYGPADAEIPKHERIDYRGTIEHDKLYDACRDVDCFIMPFKLDEVIEAVDPVKLYEYINFGKPIISVKYKEVERFRKFAELYNGYTEYCEAITRVINNKYNLVTEEDRLKFLRENTWDMRVADIKNLIEEKC